MQSLEITKPAAGAPTGGWAGAVRPWIGNRWVLTIAGLALAGTGTALGWSWLTAVGVAPLIVSAAPCLVMCAVGACAMCQNNPSRSTPGAAPTDVPPPAT